MSINLSIVKITPSEKKLVRNLTSTTFKKLSGGVAASGARGGNTYYIRTHEEGSITNQHFWAIDLFIPAYNLLLCY